MTDAAATLPLPAPVAPEAPVGPYLATWIPASGQSDTSALTRHLNEMAASGEWDLVTSFPLERKVSLSHEAIGMSGESLGTVQRQQRGVQCIWRRTKPAKAPVKGRAKK